ncbi:MAG: SRPBCC family protein [Flavipsychrobacter sp.]
MIKSATIAVIPIDVSAAQAWDIIGAVGGVDKWFGEVIKTCEVNGDHRVCGLGDGQTFDEKIILVDHQNKILRYDIATQPMIPMSNLSAYMRVLEDANGETYIEWSGNYDVTPEQKDEVNKMLIGAWQMGVKGIEQYATSLN